MIDVVVPTHGRAGHVQTLRIVPDAILVVAESQLPAYREAYPEARFDVHPDEVKGLAPKRNWIAEKYGTFFSLDDDVPVVEVITGRKAEAVPIEWVRPMIERAAKMAEELGAYLFGFNVWRDPQTYKERRPFKVTGYVPGHAFGLREGHGLWWHPECGSHEDYWISGLNAHRNRVAWIDNRYHFAQRDTMRARGGLASQRTVDDEKRSFQLLRKSFGS